jgi:non-ribosomal peptide synthetase component F/aryl carrier-like protein
MARVLDLPAGCSYATVSTFAADLGNTAIFPALCGGGLLHVVSYERALDPEAFADYLGRHPVDCLKIVPSHLSTLLSGSRPEGVLPRTLLVLGGEASSGELVARVRRLAPDLRILNHYGPTEATVGAMTYPVDEHGSPRPTLPLGGPLANTRIYVLREMRPVAAGEIGELHIGGAGLARGYLGQAAATAERYIPDPFSAAPGERLYRTGDLARFLPSGIVEFLGRVDHQVKIRGFRVELGEVESALRSHPALQETVVMLREDAPGDRRLVAYAVARPAGRPAEADLRDFLRSSLAEHMLPANVIWLEAFPIGPNGKLDRQAMPAPDRAQPEEGREAVAPRTLGEEMLTELWSEVLRGRPFGVHDNFFELGGDSLQAVQLVSRVRTVFGVELPVRSLFSNPTVAGLARTLDRSVKGVSDDEAFRLERVPRAGDLPLSFAQQRLWFMHQMNPESAAYNTSIPVRLQGRLDVAAFARAVDEVVRRHEVLRTTFPNREGEPVQLINPAKPVPLPVVDLMALPDRDREAHRLASSHAQRPFDLQTGPLLQSLLLAMEPESWILVVIMSHIVSDGWSRGILIRELITLYDGFSQGRPSPLPELPLQYADFAAWQRLWLQGEVLERHLAYWRRQLGGAAEAMALPTDRPRTATPSFRGDHLGSTLSEALTKSIHDLCLGEGATLFMVLLAAFKVLLSRSTGFEDIVVGTDTANRTRLELEELIGFFVNNLVLRTSLAGNPTFREVLARVRETTLGAYLHQDLPFELLVRELQPLRSLGQTPLFQVLFVLQNTPSPEVAIATLKASAVEVNLGLSKFDLAVFVVPFDGKLTVNWSFKTDLFDRSSVEQLSSQFATLLESIVEQPDAPVSKLEILSAMERERREREQSERRQARLDRLRRGAR